MQLRAFRRRTHSRPGARSRGRLATSSRGSASPTAREQTRRDERSTATSNAGTPAHQERVNFSLGLSRIVNHGRSSPVPPRATGEPILPVRSPFSVTPRPQPLRRCPIRPPRRIRHAGSTEALTGEVGSDPSREASEREKSEPGLRRLTRATRADRRWRGRGARPPPRRPPADRERRGDADALPCARARGEVEREDRDGDEAQRAHRISWRQGPPARIPDWVMRRRTDEPPP